MQFKTFYTLWCRFFFEQKYRIFKLAQDLQPLKISFNVQNSIYFSALSLSAGAPSLCKLWRRHYPASITRVAKNVHKMIKSFKLYVHMTKENVAVHTTNGFHL